MSIRKGSHNSDCPRVWDQRSDIWTISSDGAMRSLQSLRAFAKFGEAPFLHLVRTRRGIHSLKRPERLSRQAIHGRALSADVQPDRCKTSRNQWHERH